MPAAPELVAFINALPTPYLVLSPELVIEAASDTYLAATLTSRERLVGQYLFDAFPDNPRTPEARSVHNLRASLTQVLATGQPHQMAPQHYDVPDPAHPGQFAERHWEPLNTPVLDARGAVVRIIHSARDTTDEVQHQAHLLASQVAEQVALAEAERQQARLYQVFEEAPAMICILQGPQHVFEFANAPYRALMGERPLVGRPFAEALPELAGQGILEPLDEVYRTGEAFYANEQPARLDYSATSAAEQAPRYYNLVWQARRDQAGAVDGVLVFAYDVTPQVLARRQVQTLNEELAARNAALRVGNEEYQWANTALADTQQQLLQLNQELETRVQARAQEAGLALAEAQRQRLKVGELVQQAPAALCVVGGPDFTYEAFNPLYAAMFGGRPRVGRPMGEVLPEVVNNPGFLTFRAVYEEGRTIRQSEVLVPLARPSDGALEDRYFSYTQQPRYDSQGQIDGVFVFAVEVTDQVMARQQIQILNKALAATNQDLNASNRQLTRTNVDLDTFVYTASHDLKAPITNIEGILAALRETLPPPVLQEAVVTHLLSLLDNTVSRFLTTIDQLTDLARLQRTYDEPAEQLALAPVVAGVAADLAPLIDAAAAQVHLEVPADLHVSFAPASLRSIVYNLLSNAVKYRDPARPAQVWLQAEAQPGAVVLSVRDNGLGLSESQQGRLFGVFQRLHTHVAGTGVGLYMIKRLIENAGATIAVISEPGVGSTFTVTFPA